MALNLLPAGLVRGVARSAPVGPLRVLIAHRYCWPENAALYASMLPRIAEWHAARGDEVTLLTTYACDDHAHRRAAWAASAGVGLAQFSLRSDRGRTTAARLGTTWAYARRLWIELRGRSYDSVVVASYPPLVAGLVARWAATPSKRFVYVLQDLHPEMLAGGPVRDAASRVLRRVDAATIRASHATITISEDMRRTLLSRGVDPARVTVLPNFAVEGPRLGAGSRSLGGASAATTLVFAGGHGRLQNLDHLLDAYKIAARERPLALRTIGDGPALANLRRRVERERIAGVELLGAMPREAAQSWIEESDLGIVAARPGLFAVACPSKTASYLVAGLPVLVMAEPDTAIAAALRGSGLGFVASPIDARAAARTIVEAIDYVRSPLYSRDALARKAADRFAMSRYLERYAALFPPSALRKSAA